MTAGRPTDYTPEMLEKAREYAELAKSRALDGDDKAVGSIAELALTLDVNRSTVYEWAKTYEEFSNILERILSAQELSLTDNGLRGTFNSTITKLMLSKHGYIDKADVTSDGKAIKGNTIVLSNFDEADEADETV